MLEYGEKLLPVVSRNGRFMGVIDLDSIFEEVEQAGTAKGA
jgi:Mg/Co/Ni transporter MgtE